MPNTCPSEYSILLEVIFRDTEDTQYYLMTKDVVSGHALGCWQRAREPNEASGGLELISLSTKEKLDEVSSLASKDAYPKSAISKPPRRVFKKLIEKVAKSRGKTCGSDDQIGVETFHSFHCSEPTTYNKIDQISKHLSSVPVEDWRTWLCTNASSEAIRGDLKVGFHINPRYSETKNLATDRGFEFHCSPSVFTSKHVKRLGKILKSSSTETSLNAAQNGRVPSELHVASELQSPRTPVSTISADPNDDEWEIVEAEAHIQREQSRWQAGSD